MIKKIFNSKQLHASAPSRSRRGFTVLESLIAIVVLSLSISGVFAVVQQSLSQNIMAKDEIRAFYLAQEAIEIVRNRRDSKQLQRIDLGTGNWLDSITSDCPLSTPGNLRICTVDARSMSISQCGSNWGCSQNLRQSPSTDPKPYVYNYSAGTQTNLKREIQLESINANEIAVTVRVAWKKGIFEREFKAKTHLFNWVNR